ncbi:MAG: transcriptional repressor [candidate division Zixibacteria bacterium]|nr:transcriptional repressor [candidate division Zixibacteria bacterium]
MREFLKTKGYKMTPQRELVFRSFFELGEHVSVDELFDRVKRIDESVGYSTVWRNLKLICEVGLAREVTVGDGVTRYDRVTRKPHGHFYCLKCKSLQEFDLNEIAGRLSKVATAEKFETESFKVEIEGVCKSCRDKENKKAKRNLSTSPKISRTKPSRQK